MRTPQSSPFVAGLVGYLLALDPTLPAPTMTSNPVRDLLIQTAAPIAGAAPMIDAFAAALEVDRQQGNDKVLRALLDIDDGTVDGNTRVGPNGSSEDVDGNGGRGDGTIDMSDFRRWRDWLLQVEADPALQLDGSATHAKRDLNGDGAVENPVKEGIFPRGDFNGDGGIHLNLITEAPMTGALAGQRLSDLDVLRARFVDPNYHQTELPSLVHSVDITIDATACFNRQGVSAVLTEIQLADNPGTTIRARIHRAPDGLQEFTEHVNGPGFRILVTALDQQLNKTGSVDSREAAIDLGSDFLYTPCDFAIVTVGLPDGELTKSYSATLQSVGGTPPVTWSITGALPPGLTLNAVTGAITGIPTAIGTFGFTVSATSGSRTATKAFSIRVGVPPVVITGFIGTIQGTVGVPYDVRLFAKGGDGTYLWAVTAGALPPGIGLNASTGALSGTPATAGTFNLTLKVTSAGRDTSGTLTIPVNAPVAMLVYAGTRTISIVNDSRPAWLIAFASSSGNTVCFVLNQPTRLPITGSTCPNGDFDAWEGTMIGGVISATSVDFRHWPITGTISPGAVSLSGKNPSLSGATTSFTGVRISP